MNRIVVVPKGSDSRLLRQFQRRAVAELDRDFKGHHAAFLREATVKAKAAAAFAGSLDIKRDAVRKRVAADRSRLRRLVRGARPSRFAPLKGHNPVRYAPYSFQWSSINCGGITACSLYGPRASSGQIGADLGIFSGGGAGSGTAVGFWYYAQESGTLHVTVQASVWGRGYVYSALFGYASAWCALRVYVQRYSPSASWSASNDIYNDWGVVEFDLRTFNRVTRTVSIAVPVVAHNWYALWGAAYQSAYAGGIADSVSNFDMYVGPISYFLA